MSDPALALLRRQRHSFLNHLQVISGWLQLQKPEKAQEYLQRVAARLEADGQAIRSVPSTLGLVVLDLALEAESLGVRTEWQLSRPMPDMEPESFRAAVMAGLLAVSGQNDEQRQLVITYGPDGLRVHSPADRGEG